MIAQRGDIITGGVHHVNGVRALRQADRGVALAEIADIRQKHARAFGLKLVAQGRDI